MKKLFFSLLILTVAQFAWAAAGTENDPITFDWEKGNRQNAGQELWYDIDLDKLKDPNIEIPTLALYLTNLNPTDTNRIHVEGSLFGQTESRDYKIRPNGFQIWSFGDLSLVTGMETMPHMRVKLSANKDVALSAKLYESEDADAGCITARALNKGGAALTANTGKAQWFKLDLTQFDSKNDIVLTYTGTANGVTSMISPDCPASGKTGETFDVSGTYEHILTRALLSQIRDNNPEALAIDNTLFLVVTTPKSITVKVSEKESEAPTGFEEEVGETPTQAELETTYYVGKKGLTAPASAPKKALGAKVPVVINDVITNWMEMFGYAYAGENSKGQRVFTDETLAKAKAAILGIETSPYMPEATVTEVQWEDWVTNYLKAGKNDKIIYDNEFDEGAYGRTFYIELSELKDPIRQPEITVLNDVNPYTNTVKVLIAFSATTTLAGDAPVIEKELVVPAFENGSISFEKNMIDALNEATAKYVFVRFEPTKPIYVSARMKRLHEGDACRRAQELSAEQAIYQYHDFNWYEVNLKPAQDATNPANIRITITNISEKDATVYTSTAYACPAQDEEESEDIVLKKGESVEKVLSYATYSIVNKDKIFVGVGATQQVKVSLEVVPLEKKEQNVCAKAKVFDWTYGDVLKADQEAWYKIGIQEVYTSAMIPTLTYKNNGSETVTIKTEVYGTCEIEYEAESDVKTIAAGEKLEKLISRDLIALYAEADPAIDTVYVHISTTQDIAFFVNMKKEAEGESCFSAKLFNWVSGEDIPADSTIWYLMDFTEARNPEKPMDVELTIQNLGSEQAKLKGSLALTCPCKTTQDASSTVAAGKTRKDTIVNASLEILNDTVYLKFSCNQPLHIQARLIEPKKVEINACDKAEKLEFNTVMTEVKDSTWFYVTLDTIRKNPYIVPEYCYYNDEEEGQPMRIIKMETAYSCPITTTMISRTYSIKAQNEITQRIEREMAEAMAKHDTLYIRLTGCEKMKFAVNLVDPNNGSDCEHAIIIPREGGYRGVQQAGETAWYVLNVPEFQADPETMTPAAMLNPIIRNLNAKSGKFTLKIYKECGGEIVRTTTKTLGANAIVKNGEAISADNMRFINPDILYISLYTAQQDSVIFDVFMPDSLKPQIDACLEAQLVAPNTDYTLTSDTVWYKLDIDYLRNDNNTKGDATLMVTNNADEKVILTLDVSYVCPVVYDNMINAKELINAHSTYKKVAKRSEIQATDTALHFIYLRVSAPEGYGKTSAFRLEIQEIAGEICSNPIEFSRVNGHIQQADTFRWYLVEDVREGMILHIENISEEEVTVQTSYKTDCSFSPRRTDDYKLAAGADSIIYIDSVFVNYTYGMKELYIQHKTVGGPTHIWGEFPGVGPRQDLTVYRDTICIGTEEAYTFEHDKTHELKADDPSTWVWEHVLDTTYEDLYSHCKVDSFHITFRTMPDTAKLGDIPATAVWARGMEYDMTALTDSLLAYYQAQAEGLDTVAMITDITWLMEDPENGFISLSDMNDLYFSDSKVLSRDWKMDELTFVYTAESESDCDAIQDTLHITVDAWRMDSVVENNTICYGTEITWREHSISDTKRDTVLRDTVLNVEADTMVNGKLHKIMLDSIYTIYYHVLPDTVWETLDTLLCNGESFMWHDTILISEQKMYYDTLFNQLGCDSVLYSMDVHYMPDVDSTTYVSDTVLCYTDVIEWREMTIQTSGVYKDTLFNQLDCDSIIYTIHVEVKPEARDSVADITIPNGGTYTWFGNEYSIAGTYYDTIHYVGTECDSIWGTLMLNFETAYENKDAIVDTVCLGTEYVGVMTTHTINEYTTWNDTVPYRGETEWVDTIYTYEIYTYTTDIAPIAIDEYIHLICGQEVNADSIASATAAIKALIAAEPLFAPNYEIEWNLPKGNISSDIDEQTVSYTVKADCDVEQTFETTLSVEIATYENTAEYKSVAAKSLFGGRLLMVNLDAIRELIDTIPSENDVIWYRVVGEVDEPECTACDDEEVGRGYYYTLPDAGEIFTTGNEIYYARITLLESQTKDACGQVMRTVTLDSSNKEQKVPGIRPNYVSPGENIEVYDLDASSHTSVRVYDVEGLLIGTYSVEQAETLLLQAAPNSGFYMVNIENADNTVTLRYIVK